MVGIWIGVIQRRNNEIRNENLVNEGGILEQRRETKGKSRLIRFDQIWMEVFGLIAIFKDKILEK